MRGEERGARSEGRGEVRQEHDANEKEDDEEDGGRPIEPIDRDHQVGEVCGREEDVLREHRVAQVVKGVAHLRDRLEENDAEGRGEDEEHQD